MYVCIYVYLKEQLLSFSGFSAEETFETAYCDNNMFIRFKIRIIKIFYKQTFKKIILVQKLRAHSIRDPLLGWCKPYLDNRSSRVLLNGRILEKHLVLIGVLQGSHLRPLFLTLFFLTTFAKR